MESEIMFHVIQIEGKSYFFLLLKLRTSLFYKILVALKCCINKSIHHHSHHSIQHFELKNSILVSFIISIVVSCIIHI